MSSPEQNYFSHFAMRYPVTPTYIDKNIFVSVLNLIDYLIRSKHIGYLRETPKNSCPSTMVTLGRPRKTAEKCTQK